MVDAAAEVSGSQVDLLGHSFGGMCSLPATQLTSSIRRLPPELFAAEVLAFLEAS